MVVILEATWVSFAAPVGNRAVHSATVICIILDGWASLTCVVRASVQIFEARETNSCLYNLLSVAIVTYCKLSTEAVLADDDERQQAAGCDGAIP